MAQIVNLKSVPLSRADAYEKRLRDAGIQFESELEAGVVYYFYL